MPFLQVNTVMNFLSGYLPICIKSYHSILMEGSRTRNTGFFKGRIKDLPHFSCFLSVLIDSFLVLDDGLLFGLQRAQQILPDKLKKVTVRSNF